MIMAEVVGINPSSRTVSLSDGDLLSYDRLVIATGSDYNYFGHEEWRKFTPGLKSIHEARQIRHRLLLAFERQSGPTARLRSRLCSPTSSSAVDQRASKWQARSPNLGAS
ncbi:hypothetical protein [Neorhizobium vignae]|uniref:hypothetical protein n=1 Tax=Neorhizobium vignae TaxID=690585 RepID=UPI001FCAA428|nr:hypothetical protein [Neorhizobium vignae]